MRALDEEHKIKKTGRSPVFLFEYRMNSQFSLVYIVDFTQTIIFKAKNKCTWHFYFSIENNSPIIFDFSLLFLLVCNFNRTPIQKKCTNSCRMRNNRESIFFMNNLNNLSYNRSHSFVDIIKRLATCIFIIVIIVLTSPKIIIQRLNIPDLTLSEPIINDQMSAQFFGSTICSLIWRSVNRINRTENIKQEHFPCLNMPILRKRKQHCWHRSVFYRL